MQKGIQVKDIISQKVLSRFIINGKKFYDQPIDSNIKRYREIRKVATGQDEDYTTGCLLEL